MSLRITHDLSDGTLVDGTARGDGSREILKRYRFRWSRNLGQWYIPRSRDRIANRRVIDAAARDLRGAGFEVEVSIDNSAEDPAEREERRDERAGDRADALAAKADRKAGEADAAYGREHQILDIIPPGQPILVGHHSERRHRRDLERAENARRRGREAADEAESASQRSTAALRQRDRRHTPDYLANRISEREAEERRLQRQLRGKDTRLARLAELAGDERNATRLEDAERLDRYRDYYADCDARLTQVRADLGYFRGELAKLEAAGVKLWKQADFKKGDYVKLRGRWEIVLRANPKTIAVPFSAQHGHMWGVKYRYTEVQGRVSAEDVKQYGLAGAIDRAECPESRKAA